MASTWSNLKIQLMTTGENSTTWGTVTNANLGTAIEEAIAGSADVTFASNNQTLTLTNTTATQTARNMRLNLTGTTGGSTRTLTVPDIEKVYIVNNGCADAVQVKNSTGANVSVPAGKSMWLFSTGTAVVDVTTHLSSLTLDTALAATQGGTGITAVGTNGNVLTSTGSAWASTALPATFTAGMIMLWSGSIASIPSGWALCNGSNGTPDLRDRFVVGAGSTYAVNGTGGSADAIVVSHSHTASSSVSDPGHTHSVPEGGYKSPAGENLRYSDTAGGTNSRAAQTTGSSTTGVTVSTTVASAGTSGTNANLPPYYALAYIMKL